MKKITILLILFVVFFFKTSIIFAKNSYVLPYPSAMPGKSLYKVNLMLESITKYWYFGNFAQFEYSRKFADKYIIETKTLLEYGQYWLALKALEKSDSYFKKEPHFLKLASKENKDISEKKNILLLEIEKHIEVLKKIKNEIPSRVLWSPEKENPEELRLHERIDKSIQLRKLYELL